MAKNGKKRPAAAGGEKPKACYVLSLSVENVRCFGPKQTLDLSDGHGRPAQWTIILGENGTGKTTLLQLISTFEIVTIRYEPDKPPRSAPRFGDLMFRHLKRHGPFDSFDVLHLGRMTDQPIDVCCQIECLLGSELREAFSSDDGGVAKWTLTTEGHLEYEYFEPLYTFGYGASRRLPAPGLSADMADDRSGTLLTENAALRNAEEWLLRLDYSSAKATLNIRQQARLLRQAKGLLTSGLLPDVDGLRFNASSGPNPKPRVEFHTHYGWVPLRQLGYGYQTLIAWMLDFVSRMVERYPDSPDPLKEPAICVVDEIDLHLHPAWQRKLIGFLSERFPNTQFIATAHSPLVVQAAENANIAVLKREGDHVVIHNDVDHIRNWRVDQILTSDLFGLESTRTPSVERLFARQEALLAKRKLTRTEKAELNKIEAEIEALPVGSTPAEQRELDTIRSILTRLEKTSPR